MKRFSIIIASSVLYALATCLFIIPNATVLGGTTGLAVLIHRYFAVLSAEQIMTIFNVILLILAFAILGKKLAIGTLVGSLATAFFIFLFDLIFVRFDGICVFPVGEVFIGAALIGLASALLFTNDASSGGTDILALIVQHFSHINISTALFSTDVILVLLSFFIYGVPIGLLSVLGFAVKLLSIALFEKLLKKSKANAV